MYKLRGDDHKSTKPTCIGLGLRFVVARTRMVSGGRSHRATRWAMRCETATVVADVRMKRGEAGAEPSEEDPEGWMDMILKVTMLGSVRIEDACFEDSIHESWDVWMNAVERDSRLAEYIGG